MKKRIVSGITATGQLTIGNYIGAIKNFIKFQDEYDMFIFVADLHALTIDIDSKNLRENKKNIMALYLACGLDPEKTTLFFQSDVLEHGIMNWIIENRTTIGELQRMTQFKDKSLKSNNKDKVKTGILTYPALMAGDILLYNPSLVPVGKDQKQHLELTRNIAERFNNEYGKTFIIPEPFITKNGSKIMSLKDPSKKMSKSSPSAKSYIALLDDPEKAYKKIMKSVTDGENKVYASKEKEGITNLMTIYSELKGFSFLEIENEFKGQDYKKFKDEVGKAVKSFLENLQKKYNDSIEKVDEVAKNGAIKARKLAKENLKIIYKKIGLK
ncbi:MAG: tryptophan--tRNA ligase [Mollicutes bacterium PWAP]|nr:tryptophan--tRNA ligase [Mollicutes bacterium PWAP]